MPAAARDKFFLSISLQRSRIFVKMLFEDSIKTTPDFPGKAGGTSRRIIALNSSDNLGNLDETKVKSHTSISNLRTQACQAQKSIPRIGASKN
jgi:hypothetical protein